MAKSLVSPVFSEFLRRCANGQYSDEQIQAFMQDPNASLKRMLPMTEEFIGLAKNIDEESPIIYDGKRIAFIVNEERSGMCVDWCGQKLTTFPRIELSSLMFANNLPLYMPTDGGKDFLVLKDQLASDSYDHIDEESLRVVDGKPLFVAENDGSVFPVWGWEVADENAVEIRELQGVNGRMLYVVSKDGKDTACWGTMRYSPHDEIKFLSILDGKFLYVARDGEERRVIWGDWVSKAYPHIHALTSYRQKPLYLVSKDTAAEAHALLHHDVMLTIGEGLVPGNPLLTAADDVPVYCYHDRKKLLISQLMKKHTVAVAEPISEIRIVDSKPLYIGLDRNNKIVIVWGSLKTKAYNVTSTPIVSDKEIVFCGLKNRRLMRVAIPRRAA